MGGESNRVSILGTPSERDSIYTLTQDFFARVVLSQGPIFYLCVGFFGATQV